MTGIRGTRYYVNSEGDVRRLTTGFSRYTDQVSTRAAEGTPPRDSWPIVSTVVAQADVAGRSTAYVDARHELGITTDRGGDRMLRGEVARAFEVARADRDHLRAEQRVGGSDDAARSDAGRAQDADAYHGRRVSHECRRCGTLSRQE